MVITFMDKHNIQLSIDRSMYSESVIHKCLYWYGSKLLVDIEKGSETYQITLSDPSGDLNLEDLVTRIRRDLIDFKTREIVTRETKDIRAMLIAKAFANDDTFDEEPSSILSDPLGFDPSTF